MEFYFSTPNLQKDRFLKKLVMSDPEGCECQNDDTRMRLIEMTILATNVYNLTAKVKC